MDAYSSSPLSFEALAHALAILAVFNKTLPAGERALQRGINIDSLRFQYTAPLFGIINDSDTLLGRRWMGALTRSTAEDYIVWIETVLQDEFALFLQQTDSHTQERSHILTELAAPAAVVARIQELCFFPKVIFPWCMAIVGLAEHMRACNRLLRTQLDPLEHHLGEINFFFTSPHAFPLMADIACMRQLTQEVDAWCSHVDAWRKQLKIDKQITKKTQKKVDGDRLPYPHTQVSIEPQKQRIWSFIFKELVDCLHPYCSGPKRHSWAKRSSLRPPIPDQAFQHASRLVHLAHPALWPNDDYKLVKTRYHALT